MLNMLIAIMGDTFDRHMENRDVNAIKAKLSLMSSLDGVIDTNETFSLKEVIQRIDSEEHHKYNEDSDFGYWDLLEESVEVAAALIGRRRKKKGT